MRSKPLKTVRKTASTFYSTKKYPMIWKSEGKFLPINPEYFEREAKK